MEKVFSDILIIDNGSKRMYSSSCCTIEYRIKYLMKYSEFEAFRRPAVEETLENPVLERVPKVQGRTG